jgi:hypothetical protein
MPAHLTNSFRVDDYAIRYSNFIPRLFNFCLSLGMKPNRIMPSRAFCSDENQGYPIILIAKHFGSFPFNHGRVGGIVATDRHGPHAHHGQDMVIIQASHVGYEPDSGEFGIYRRLQTENQEYASDCGAICNVLNWYQNEFNFASQHITLDRDGDEYVVIIDNQLLSDDRDEGLFLNLGRLIDIRDGHADPIQLLSTAKAYRASPELVNRIGTQWPEKRQSIGRHLYSDLFYFRRNTAAVTDASHNINRNLIKSMPAILSSKYPALTGAQVNAQVEFDRTFRTIVKEHAYRGKKVVFISGIHIDVSPREGQIFPLTKYVPWAAYIQNESGEGYTLEQDELHQILEQQSQDNPYKIDLTEAIGNMKREAEIHIHVDHE